ncbi:FAD-binding oxidoreductase [Gillisia sp. M10.2A]|uniref:FAD-binding oxidoreductase n=1 Tax=Gillisia lutea TaxID=2909668 RepID=A0ABS9EB57_9FLAO|nr:FAD-dependent oxidoreductase [Gillisia lutea]MCF4100122.1 FAD-binding oxidoreductase [Gillisia lutea]
MVDYIIVGAGLSGIAVTEELLSMGKTVRVFENNSQSSSTVAGGVFNPVILKRFTLAWQADEQMKIALPFYKALENKLNEKLIHDLPIFRKFSSIEEQNNWFAAMDKTNLVNFLNPKLYNDLNENLPSNFSFGQVMGTGAVNTKLLLEAYREYLRNVNLLDEHDFKYEEVRLLEGKVEFKGTSAGKIIFCDGFGLKDNPFFNYLPMNGNKGEYLVIRSKELKLNVAVKSSVFILPLGDDLYKVGATYNNFDKSSVPSQEAREQLLQKLETMITCKFEVVDQIAGIRPSTNDRKPLVGMHPKHTQLYCCNGFGSRGVLIGPTVAKQLIQFIERGVPLPSDINLKRFEKKHYLGL